MWRRFLAALAIAFSLFVVGQPALAAEGSAFDSDSSSKQDAPAAPVTPGVPAAGDSEDKVIRSANPVVYVGDQSESVPGVVNSINGTLSGSTDILVWDDKNKTIEFDITYYKSLNYTERRNLMEQMLKSVSDSSMNNKQRSKIYNFISDQDTEISRPIRMMQTNTNLDTVRAGSIIKGAFPVFNIILGLLVVITFLGVILSTVVDMLYISIPFLQSADAQNGRFTASAKRCVSSTARMAVDLGNEKGKSGLGFYAKKRAGVLLVVSFVLLLIMTGHMWDLLLMVADSLSVLLPQR